MTVLDVNSTVTVAVHQRVELHRLHRRKHERLPEILATRNDTTAEEEEESEGSSGCLGIASRTNRSGVPGVERPASDAGEVAVVCLLGFEVEVLEQQAHVVPVLHLEHVGLIGDHKLQRRQEVIVALLITVKES